MSLSRLAIMLFLSISLSGFGPEPEVTDVFVPKADGFASIRIPSVVVSKKGTVLAFAEGRATDADQAKNKIVLKRSTDGGKVSLTLVGHGGDTICFHSTLQLIPEKGVGVFLSYNTTTSGGEREQVLKAFLDRYFPVTLPARGKSIAGFAERARQVAGEYGNTRHSHTTIAKLAALMMGTTVKVNDDETLTIAAGGNTRRYVEVKPLHYRELDGTREMVFQTDSQGNVVHLFNANSPYSSFIKRKWYEESMMQGGMLAVCAALFLTAILVWPAVGWNLRHVNTAPVLRSGLSAFLSWMGWIMSLLILVFAGALGTSLADPDGIVFGLTPTVKWLMLVPQVIAALAGITLLGALIAWGMRYWRFMGRLHYTLVALAGAGFVWFLYHWNLLSWGMGDLKL